MEWWSSLDGLNQFFYGAAAVMSGFFIWQLVMALLGLAGHDDVTSQVDTFDHTAVDHTAASDAHDSVLAFKLISVRSILAFLTLFFWASALYYKDHSLSVTMLIATAWGVAAMAVIAWIFNLLMKMTESGNPRISTAVGAPGTVYMNIPANGVGEIRVMVSGVMSNVRARTRDGQPVMAGRKVMVTKVLDANMVEVIPEQTAS
jgi:hypothetical protein